MAENRDSIAKALMEAIAVTMNKPIDQLTEDTQLIADLGAKSVNLVRIIGSMEDEFDLDISFREFKARKTIRELIDYLVELQEL